MMERERGGAKVSIHKMILISLSTLMLAAASPLSASAWETVFEIHASDGKPTQENLLLTLINLQNKVTIGVEVMGIKIGYHSRHGLAAVREF